MMFEAQRLHYLEALGLQPLQLRHPFLPQSPLSAELMAGQTLEIDRQPDASYKPQSSPAPMDLEHGQRLQILLNDQDIESISDEHARLMSFLLKTIGVSPEHVRFGGEPGDGDLVISFGLKSALASVNLQRLGALRDPIEKRIAWPHLRRFRKQWRLSQKVPS